MPYMREVPPMTLPVTKKGTAYGHYTAYMAYMYAIIYASYGHYTVLDADHVTTLTTSNTLVCLFGVLDLDHAERVRVGVGF